MNIAQIKAFLHILILVLGVGIGQALAQDDHDHEACDGDAHNGETFAGRNINSSFGHRDTGINGASTFHRALDLRSRDNPMMGALFGGTVTTGYQINPATGTGYGNHAIITNGNFRQVYAHAGSLSVTNGQTIGAGTVLGNWTTGTGTAQPHVHVEYQVMGPDGTWAKVDPYLAQAMIDSGMDPQSAEFAQAAIEATANGCGVDEDALHTGANAGGVYNEENELCDPNIKAQIVDEIAVKAAFRQDAMRQAITPPASVEQVANTPCMSKELQKITNQFADAPNALLGGLTGSLGSLSGAMGPASGIMNKMFESGFQSLNGAAEFLPQMLNFQSQASGVLSGLLGSLGGTDAFSSELCGMMVDMVVKFVQCQFPIEMPSFGSIGITGSLNDLLPDGCAGEAMRDAMYGAASMTQNLTVGQPVLPGANGRATPGTARQHNPD